MFQVYKYKLRAFAYSRNANARMLFASMTKKAKYVREEDIQQNGEWKYLVPSETNVGTHYEVDTRCFTCECVYNLRGQVCKHLFAVMMSLKFNAPNVHNLLPPITIEDRYLMAYVALGDMTPNIEFFAPLHTDGAGT